MKLSRLLLVLAALLFPVLAFAQTANTGVITVQHTATELRAVQLNADASGTAQQTLTLTCPASQYVYLVYYDELASATTAPAATLLTTTTTNFNGKKLYNFVTAAVGAARVTFYPATPYKSTTNTATIVSNAAVTNVTYSMDAGYYCAP